MSGLLFGERTVVRRSSPQCVGRARVFLAAFWCCGSGYRGLAAQKVVRGALEVVVLEDAKATTGVERLSQWLIFMLRMGRIEVRFFCWVAQRRRACLAAEPGCAGTVHARANWRAVVGV